MSKKTTNSGISGDPTVAQENLNTLYTAHQVHTLAQMLFQQLAAWQVRGPWSSPAGAVFAQPLAMPGMAWPAPGPAYHPQGFVQGAPQALVYWYP